MSSASCVAYVCSHLSSADAATSCPHDKKKDDHHHTTLQHHLLPNASAYQRCAFKEPSKMLNQLIVRSLLLHAACVCTVRFLQPPRFLLEFPRSSTRGRVVSTPLGQVLSFRLHAMRGYNIVSIDRCSGQNGSFCLPGGRLHKHDS